MWDDFIAKHWWWTVPSVCFLMIVCLEKHRISRDDIAVGRILGEGFFGEVHNGVYKSPVSSSNVDDAIMLAAWMSRVERHVSCVFTQFGIVHKLKHICGCRLSCCGRGMTADLTWFCLTVSLELTYLTNPLILLCSVALWWIAKRTLKPLWENIEWCHGESDVCVCVFRRAKGSLWPSKHVRTVQLT